MAAPCADHDSKMKQSERGLRVSGLNIACVGSGHETGSIISYLHLGDAECRLAGRWWERRRSNNQRLSWQLSSEAVRLKLQISQLSPGSSAGRCSWPACEAVVHAVVCERFKLAYNGWGAVQCCVGGGVLV